MPTSNLGVPWYTGFAWKYVNYTILVVPGAMIAVVDLLAPVGEELVHRAEEDRSTSPTRSWSPASSGDGRLRGRGRPWRSRSDRFVEAGESRTAPAGLCEKIEVLHGRAVEAVELAGGLTNRNLKVTTR